MSDCISASRLVATLLLVFLIWGDVATKFTDGDQDAEAAPEVAHMSGVTSRGGPRPFATIWPGLEVLVAQSRLPAPPSPVPPTATPAPTPTAQPKLKDLGTFKVTAYSDSVRNGTDGRGITRSGEKTHWGVVAVDASIIPLGSRLVIEGMEGTVFTALDTGGGIIGRWVDVWYGSDWEAIQRGVRHLRVQLVVE